MPVLIALPFGVFVGAAFAWLARRELRRKRTKRHPGLDRAAGTTRCPSLH